MAQIRETSNPRNWNFVPTHLNPADMLSRGVSLQTLLHCALWTQGPEFLTTRSLWPRHGVTWSPDPPLFRDEEM